MPSLIATLGLNASGFKGGLDQAREHAASTGKQIQSALGDFVGEKLGSFVSIGALEEGIRKTIEFGGKVADLSDRLGISTDAVQQWDYALQQNGSSVEAAAGFFEKLAVNRQKALQGSDEQIAAFKKLGVTLDDLKNKNIEDIGSKIAGAVERGDPQELIASLREVGGKGAGELVAAFRNHFQEELAKAPLIPEGGIAELDRIGDEFTNMGKEIKVALAGPIIFVYNLVKELSTLVVATTAALTESAATFFKSIPQKGLIGALMPSNIKDSISAGAEVLGNTINDAAKKREELMTPKKKSGPLTELPEDKEKARKDKEEAEKVAKLKEEIAKKDFENGLQELTTAEKIVALREKMLDLIQQSGTELKESDKLKKISEAEDVGKQLQKEQMALEKEKKFTVFREDLTANQRIGALARGPDVAMIDVAKKSENHLANILHELQQNRNTKPHAVGTHF